jgi:hypothetical protein
METYSEGEWSHPRIHEAAFQPPVGYEIVAYRINSRTTTVHYYQTDAHEVERLARANLPDSMSAESCPYLEVETWVGSGNSTVALAPWKRAHDNERKEIADPPEKCGIEVALTTAREFARTSTDGDDLFPTGSYRTNQSRSVRLPRIALGTARRRSKVLYNRRRIMVVRGAIPGNAYGTFRIHLGACELARERD